MVKDIPDKINTSMAINFEYLKLPFLFSMFRYPLYEVIALNCHADILQSLYGVCEAV